MSFYRKAALQTKRTLYEGEGRDWDDRCTHQIMAKIYGIPPHLDERCWIHSSWPSKGTSAQTIALWRLQPPKVSDNNAPLLCWSHAGYSFLTAVLQIQCNVFTHTLFHRCHKAEDLCRNPRPHCFLVAGLEPTTRSL